MVNRRLNTVFTYVFSAVLVLSTTAFASTGSTKRVILDGDRSVEEQIKIPNVTYIIKDAFTQTDAVISIPDNCTLAFKGGKILNANLKLGENVTITNGTIEIAEDGCVELNNNSVIKNCSFSNKSYCKVGYGNLYADACLGIRIKKCTFAPQKRQTKGKCSSIDLRRCEDFIIEKVESDYTEGENIIVYEGIGYVRKCTLRMGWSGIGTVIYGMTEENPKQGRQGSSDSRIIIINNTVRNTLAAGITINSNNVICEKNDVAFENCTVNGPGIRLGHVHSPANSCIVSKNVIKWNNSNSNGKSTTNRGISLDAGNDNLITDNSVENVPVGIGSSVSNKTRIVITGNDIKNASDYGVSIYESEELNNMFSIEGNTIQMQGGIGVWVRNCNSNIKRNKISFPTPKTKLFNSPYFCYGILIEDNPRTETFVNKNIIEFSEMPVKAVLKGKRVTITDNKYLTEQDCSFSVKETTMIEESNNKYRYIHKH